MGGIAFDYIGNNLYLSNKEDKTIEVHSLTTKTKTVFYFEQQPSNIALAPEEGYDISDCRIRLTINVLINDNVNIIF